MGARSFEAEFCLIGDIYDAVLEPALWPCVMQAIAEVGNADKTMFTATDLLNPSYSFNYAYGIAPEIIQAYRDDGIDKLEMEFMVRQWMDPLGVGIPSASNLHWGEENYRAAGGRYVEFANNVAGIHHQAPIIFERSEFRFVGLGLNNGKHHPFTEAHLNFLLRLAPHMRRALQMHQQITDVKRKHAQLYAMLDVMVTGVLLIARNGLIRYANPRAEKLLRQHGGLRVGFTHELQAVVPEQNQQLQTLIRGAIATSQRDSQGQMGGVLGVTAKTATPLMLTVTPLSELAGYQELASDHIAAAIFLNDPTEGHVVDLH